VLTQIDLADGVRVALILLGPHGWASASRLLLPKLVAAATSKAIVLALGILHPMLL
jgi:hypothetical protein